MRQRLNRQPGHGGTPVYIFLSQRKRVCALLWGLFLILAVLAVPCIPEAADKSGVDPAVISLPEGPGSIEGLGESFEPDLNSGTAGYQVKIEVSPGTAGFQPELALSYDSGFGNGILGIGWKLNLPFIQRQTDKGLPGYDDSDRFIYSGQGELVPLENGFFRLKIETSFTRFQKTADSWLVWDRSGVRHDYGETASSRLETDSGTFQWFPERSVDPNGNEIQYTYFKDGAAVYLEEIRYGFADDASTYRSVVFEYEDRDDQINDYRSRFQIVTAKRLKRISVFCGGQMARKYELEYTHPTYTSLSLLQRLTQWGSDGIEALPPLTFTYENADFSLAQTVSMSNPPPVSLKRSDTDLVDIDGDSLPDILDTPATGHRFYMNQGAGTWSETPAKPAVSPGYQLSLNGALMGDLDGNGRSDLVVQSMTDFGFFRNSGAPWEKEEDWIAFSSQPDFSLEDPNTRLLDCDNDGLMDVLYSQASGYRLFLNDDESPWTRVLDTPNPGLLFSDVRVKTADMNGDRMEDLVYLDAYGSIYYLPNMGYGTFDGEAFMNNCPTLSESQIQNGTILLMDANGDGLADLVRTDSYEITVWVNRGDNSFSQANTVEGAPSFSSGVPALRQADMDGDGCRDLLYSLENVPVEQAYQFVAFSGGNHPNLLVSVDNGLGSVTTMEYKSSTSYYLEAIASGNPWQTKLPYPVTLVGKKTVLDKNSAQEYVTVYVYRDGYYDGEEREFRGFQVVEQVETGGPGAPTLKTRHAFDVGKTEESRKGLPLERTLLKENGSSTPPSGIFSQTLFSLDTRELATGIDGEHVSFSFIASEDVLFYEKTDDPRRVRTVHDFDDYGNETENFRYGEIVGEDLGAGSDEVLTTKEYFHWIDSDRWMIDRLARARKTTLAGAFVSDAKYFYDDNGNLIREEKSPDGASWVPVVRNQYDSFGNIVRITDSNGHARTIGYDSVFHTFPIAEIIEGLNLTVAATYDPVLGKILSFQEFNGHVTQFQYDTLGRLIAIIKPGDSENYPTQSFQYELSDPVSRVVAKQREVSGEPGTYDSYTYYDGLGRKLQVRTEGADGQWIVNEAVSFNLRGKEEKKWLPYFASTENYEPPPLEQPGTSFEYDPLARPVKEINPDASWKLTEYLPLGQRVWDEEDSFENGTHQGTPHVFFHDGLERLVEVREQNGDDVYVTSYAYDGLDNLVRIQDAAGNVKTMTFDGLGRKTAMDDPDKGAMAYSYDDAGNLLQTIDNKDQTVTWTYDAANRVLTENFQGVRVQYHYDEDLPPDHTDLQNTKGKLSWVEDESGVTGFSYDARGNTVAKIRKIDGLTYLTANEFDAMDRVVLLVYPDGDHVRYEYDAANRLSSIPGFVKSIRYNAAGQKTSFIYENGIESAYEYDNRQRLQKLATTNAPVVLQDLNYTYDRASNIVSITDGRENPTPESRTAAYQYDDLYRLTKCTALDWHIDYQYDAIGNMTDKTSDVPDPKVNLGALSYGEGDAGPHAVTTAGPFTYAYDGNGNVKTKTGYAFAFDYKDRMVSMDRTSDGLHAEYRYDYTGNRTTKVLGTGENAEKVVYVDQFTEIRNDRLVEHVFAGNRRVARIGKHFDPSSLIEKVQVLEAEDFDSDQSGSVSLAELKAQGDNPDITELSEAREGIKIFKGSLRADQNDILPFSVMAPAIHELEASPVEGAISVHLYIPDHLGSASIVAEKNGQVVEESVFYPYGMSRKKDGSFCVEYRFTGKELDGESDLYFFGARYYDSAIGHFISVDALFSENEEKSTNESIYFNKYSYVKNRPIIYVDPIGFSEMGTNEWNEEFIRARNEDPAKYERMKNEFKHWYSHGGLQAKQESIYWEGEMVGLDRAITVVSVVKKTCDVGVDVLSAQTGMTAVGEAYDVAGTLIEIGEMSPKYIKGDFNRKEVAKDLSSLSLTLVEERTSAKIDSFGKMTRMTPVETEISKSIVDVFLFTPLEWAKNKAIDEY